MNSHELQRQEVRPSRRREVSADVPVHAPRTRSGARTPALLWLAWIGAIVGTGVVVIAADPTFSTPGPLDTLADTAVADLGHQGAALACLILGGGIVIGLCWPLGKLAHALEHAVDWPTYHWVNSLYHQRWSKAWWRLTNIGKPRVNQVAALAGGVFYAIVWGHLHLGWWKPLIGLPMAYAVVKYGQIFLLTTVDRGHPPQAAGGRPTRGTYPSGGCARVIVIYGTIVFLTVLWLWPSDPQAWYVGWTVTAALWGLQAYARLYNNEHWLTDVVGGTVYGALLLAVVTTSFRLLLR